MPSKSPLLSKTLWVNLVVAIAAFIPPVSAFLSANPTIFVVVFSIVNVLLRLVTKQAIEIA